MWTCPHCGAEHHPGAIVRLDKDHVQCPKCKQSFPSALRATRTIGCFEVPEKHDCGGKLRRQSMVISGAVEFVTVYCDKCFKEVKFEGPHVSEHDR